tara:strand:+ start:116 stop:544 length:429 start_codon:yes stop_codon:yes gene_type:complete
MKYKIDNNKVYVKLDKNDLINQSLLDLSNDLSLNFVWLNGIGAIKNPEMGYFDIDRKDYDRKIFNGDYELTSYMGNISLKDGERFIHSHISFSDSKYNVFGGHLFDAKISAAGEFILFLGNKNINRYFDNDVGLFFWKCEEE